MSVHPVLIAGEWRQADAQAKQFSPANPATRQSLPDSYPVSDRATLETALAAGLEAARALSQVEPERIAQFLEACAENLEKRRGALVEIANQETGLPVEPRLASVELPRTQNQLKQAAKAVRERSFCQPTIDTKANIRSIRGPLGGIVFVFGPNNFPFAFNSMMGGDFAAAIAAGNPVLGKGHPAHPGTTRLLAEAAFDAVKQAGLHPATVQLAYGIPRELGLDLVRDPRVAAVGFTGSRQGGLKLKAAADQAGKPAYLELSSINPVFILPGALEQKGDAIADELFGSCTLGTGQFCTKPGISVVVESSRAQALLSRVKESLESRPPGVLFTSQAPKNIAESIETLKQYGATVVTGGTAPTEGGFRFDNTLLRVSAEQFLKHPDKLQTEAFGPVHLMVFAADLSEMQRVAEKLEGNLTGCIYSDESGKDDASYDAVAAILRRKVGRLLNDKMPTGVAVSPAMNHGGPFPSTGHPGFTSVGIPASITRFTALHCYDAVRENRLPRELRNENPAGIWRYIDGNWTQAAV